MYNTPSPEELARLPGLYETDKVPPADKVIHMHFFLGGCDWYIAEFDPKDRILFGYAILNGDLENAEWGNMSLDELVSLKTSQGFQVDRDLYWRPKKVRDIPNIRSS